MQIEHGARGIGLWRRRPLGRHAAGVDRLEVRMLWYAEGVSEIVEPLTALGRSARALPAREQGADRGNISVGHNASRIDLGTIRHGDVQTVTGPTRRVARQGLHNKAIEPGVSDVTVRGRVPERGRTREISEAPRRMSRGMERS
jgi:hypothetical protein